MIDNGLPTTSLMSNAQTAVDNLPLVARIREEIQKVENNPSLSSALKEAVLTSIVELLEGLVLPYGLYKTLREKSV